MLLKKGFLMPSGKLGGPLRRAVVFGRCLPTKRGSAGSTVLGHPGPDRGKAKSCVRAHSRIHLLRWRQPKDRACCYLIMPAADTECFQLSMAQAITAAAIW
jgi:hypothetical protein